MANIQVYKKPQLILLEEKKKIRDYPAEQRLAFSYKIVENLLADLGVGKNSDTEHHKRVIKAIADDYGKYTFEEIQNAFKLAIMGVLNIELFQQINVLVFAKVMKLYEEHKKNKLRTYRLNKQKPIEQEMTNEEIQKFTEQALTKQLTNFLQTRTIDKKRIYVYDIFDKAGMMPTDIQYKKSVHKDAITILKQEYQTKKANSREEHKQIKKFLAEVTDQSLTEEIKWKCKELALEDFLRKEIKNAEDVNRLIEKVFENNLK
tara:strand:+ start:318 stop:1100 length:783 start_codon:yes stop_codon:yes gene_type:complete